MAKKTVSEKPVQVHELSTGYKISAKKVPSMLVYDAQQTIALPVPPKVKITSGGSTYVSDNPSDPHFSAMYEDAMRARNMAALEVLIRRGIVLEDPLPKSDEWLEDLETDIGPLLDKYRGDDGKVRERYKQYLFLRYVAVADQDDFELVSRISTLSASEVLEAEENFSG